MKTDFFQRPIGAAPAPPAHTDPLPAQARAKLVALEGEAVDCRDAAASAARRVGDLQRSLAINTVPEDAAGMELELNRLRMVREQQDHRHRELSALAVALRQWVRTRPPHQVLELVRPPAAKPGKGETVLAAIGRVRDAITAAQQHLSLVRTAPLPKRDLKALARQHVQRLAQRGQPHVNREGVVTFSDPKAFAVSLESAVAVAAWLDPENMIRKLEAVIDNLPEPALALSPAEKETRVSQLLASLDQLERQEEALIGLAIAEGSDLLRRSNASALAVLGVVPKVKKPAVAAA